jgi:hypothetical protein
MPHNPILPLYSSTTQHKDNEAEAMQVTAPPLLPLLPLLLLLWPAH